MIDFEKHEEEKNKGQKKKKQPIEKPVKTEAAEHYSLFINSDKIIITSVSL